MKVLIVAKTRQGAGACIGGITLDGRSVRLIAADAATNERVGREYEIGEVWEIDGGPPDEFIPLLSVSAGYDAIVKMPEGNPAGSTCTITGGIGRPLLSASRRRPSSSSALSRSHPALRSCSSSQNGGRSRVRRGIGKIGALSVLLWFGICASTA